jgi:hypothetical protein
MSADVDSGSGSDGGSDSDGLVRDELAHLHGPGVARRRAARALRLAERRSATLSSENDALRVQLTMLRERETAAVLAAATARGQAEAAATSEAAPVAVGRTRDGSGGGGGRRISPAAFGR